MPLPLNPHRLRAQQGRSGDGVAPPGWEKTIQKMKKSDDVDNPFALAWWLRRHGAKPTKDGDEASLDAQIATALTVLAKRDLPEVCYAAARGERWAQAELLASSAPIYDGMVRR